MSLSQLAYAGVTLSDFAAEIANDCPHCFGCHCALPNGEDLELRASSADGLVRIVRLNSKAVALCQTDPATGRVRCDQI